MKIQVFIAALCLFFACEVPEKEDARMGINLIGEQKASAIDKVFDDIEKDGPGGALAVVRNGEIIYSKGYGLADLEHDVPITPSTVFYIGSVSKMFVTFSILQLVEKGLVNLDDDVRKYIPEFPDYGNPLTIRHFIHHTSGVRDYLTLWEMAGNNYLDEIPKQAVLDIICRQKELNFVPGTRYLYSNSCYYMLALIIERVTDQSMSDYGRQNIFGPLKMTSSRFHEDNTMLIENRAFSYTYNNDESRWNNLISRFDLVGSGGIYSSVEDLALWDQVFYNNPLGSQAMIDTMKTDGKLNDGSSAEYAFAVVNGTYRGLQTLGHGGALAGYRANFLQFPDERTSIIILSNFARFGPSERAYKVADIILEDKLGEREEDDNQDSGSSDAEDIYSGEFFTNIDNILGRFYSEELDTYYHLEKNVDGNVQLKVGYTDPIPLEIGERNMLEAGPYLQLEFENENNFRVQAGRVQNMLLERSNN